MARWTLSKLREVARPRLQNEASPPPDDAGAPPTSGNRRRIFAPLGFLPAKGFSDGLLPWVLAALVFLASLASLGGISLSQSIDSWRQDVATTLTVQVTGEDAVQIEREVEAALDVLRHFPGIEAAQPLPEREIEALLEPWLGAGNIDQGLPIPRLINVSVKPGVAIDKTALSSVLSEAAPHAKLDDPQNFLGQVIAVAQTVQGLAVAVIVLIVLVSMAIIVYAAYARMAIHRNIVEVVHLMGARNAMIAREFQWRFMTMGLKAGLLGLLLALLALMIIDLAIGDFSAAVMPTLRFTPMTVTALILIPLLTALLTTITSYMTVKKALADMA